MGNSQPSQMDTRGDRSVMKKKIVVKGPALSASGYGEQARFALRSLQQSEDLFDIFLINIPWGRTGHAILSKEEKVWINSLIGKTQAYAQQSGGKLQFDISLQITIPNEFEKMADVNIGYTAGIETTKVSPQWIDKSNMMDKIIVPSNHSKNVFEQTSYKARNQQTGEEVDFKLRTPVEVCAFPANVAEHVIPELVFSTDFNFLSVAQWGPRKNLLPTIRNFVKEFKNDDDVGLVLKVSMAKNTIMDKEITRKKTKQVLEEVKKEVGDYKCKVYLLHGTLTDEEMRGLYRHPQIKAFVTTTHGEGFGLPMFEAAIAGLPIAAPAWSSYVDFLYAPKKDKDTGKVKNKPHFVKIDFDLKPVEKEAVWDGVIQADSQWCWVKDHSVRDAIRELRKNHTAHVSAAKKLSSFIVEEFSEDKQFKKMSFLVTGEEPEEEVGVEELPTISLITSLFRTKQFLPQLIENTIGQTIFEQKCEWIILDANPKGEDEDYEILKPFLEKYPNIRYERLEEDPGIYGVWNMAIKKSTGQFLTNINADDRRSPEALEKQARFLLKRPEASLVYNDSFIVHEPNVSWEKIPTNCQKYNFEQFSKDAMLRTNLPHNNPMWRKELHDKHGLFEEKYRSASDWEFWLRCAFAGETFVKHPKVLGIYYFNPKGMSTNQEHNDWKKQEEKEIFKKYLNLFQESAK